MKKNKITLSALLSVVLIIGISCEKKVGKLPEEAQAAPVPVNTCDTITYTRHIRPIIDGDCRHCHNSSLQSGNTNLETYALVRSKAEAGRIKARVLDGVPSYMPMDKGKLPKAKLDLIACWLNNGMKE